MDFKRLFTMMVVAGAVMLAFQFFMGNGNKPASQQPGTYAIYRDPKPAQFYVGEKDASREFIQLGDPEKDNFVVTIDPVMASIDKVQLNKKDYAQTVKREKPLTLFSSDALPAHLPKAYATIGLHVRVGGNKAEEPMGVVAEKDKDGNFLFRDGEKLFRATSLVDSTETIAAANSTALYDRHYVWRTVEKTATSAKLGMTLLMGGKPLMNLYKTFTLNSPSAAGSYDLTITHTVENLSDNILNVSIDQLGSPDLPRDDPQGDDRFFNATGLASADKALAEKHFNAMQYELAKFESGTKSVGQFSDFDHNPTLWVASSNRFFVAIMRPLPGVDKGEVELKSKNKIPIVSHIASANVDVMRHSDKPQDVLGIIRFTGTSLEISAQSKVDEPMAVFLGPKRQEILQGNPGAAVGTEERARSDYGYVSVIQYNQGCGFCAFGPIVHVILWLLEFFKSYVAFGNYGVAIIVLVIVVRLLLHPLTRASQINMAVMGKKMKAVQPQLEAVKKKYAGNRQKLNEETLKVYREHSLNPAGGILGCLPMLLQMPIWAALYSGLRTDLNLRHAPFIPGWINDLSNPDTVLPANWSLGHPAFTVPFVGWEVYGLNLLPILLGLVFYVNMKVMSASTPPATDPQQAQMQKMSQYMILIFPLFLYNAPSGLNLYIFASTIGGIFDTYLVRKTLKKRGILPTNAPALPMQEEK